MNETWSWGVLIGLPILILATLFFIGFGIWLIKHDDGYGEIAFGGVVSLVVAFCFVIGISWGFYPYKTEYHKWIPKEGTVTNIDRRIVGGSDSINEKIVVTYEDGNQYGCNDTRCASVRKGDHLILTCKRTWQFAGIDGYDCNFVQLRKA